MSNSEVGRLLRLDKRKQARARERIRLRKKFQAEIDWIMSEAEAWIAHG